MTEGDGLIAAYVLDGKGHGREVDWTEIGEQGSGSDFLWIHLDLNSKNAHRWLKEESGIEEAILATLLAEQSRPRVTVLENAFLVILRGVNLNPGAEPDDMVGIRLYVEERRVISLCFRQLMAVNDLRAEITKGKAPKSSGGLLVRLCEGLTERMSPVIRELEDLADTLEDGLIKGIGKDFMDKLSDLRHTAATLKRHISPQRDAIKKLLGDEVPFLKKAQKTRLRETAEDVVRHVEDLELLRERASVMQDELRNRQSDKMNRTMYILTMVATIMLPMSVIAGLLGMNVGGIPLGDNPLGFLLTTLFILLLGGLMAGVFKILKWL